ncbi:MAG TPA: polysaccharide deacetylase family protein [Pyrinomonadaceae bacterium]
MRKKLYITIAVLVIAAALLLFLRQFSSARSFQAFGTIVDRVETSRKIVALTFDDGPTPEVTRPLLDLLEKEQVRATFFVTGAELEKQMNLGIRIAAMGHELGNHSYSHTRMIFVTPSFVQSEIERTDALIREAGYQNPIHFRPPYGKKLFVLPYYLSQNGRTTVTWDIEPDSNTRATAGDIAREAVEQTRPGSIILLHVMYANRVESFKAVGKITNDLKANGYEFVTVSELMSAAQ